MTNAALTTKIVKVRLVARIESKEKGQSLVEMTMVLSFLFLMSFGMIDISRCVYTSSVVTAAAQEGARVGILDITDIHNTIARTMVGLDITKADITVTVNDDIIEVDITYDFDFITPLVDPLLDGLVLHGRASNLKSE